MIQNAIKILTLGFFISMITGFVMYRTGAFDSTTASNAFHTSPNGGELNNANQAPNSNGATEINQQNTNEIMPSSKSMLLPNEFNIDVEEIQVPRNNFQSLFHHTFV